MRKLVTKKQLKKENKELRECIETVHMMVNAEPHLTPGIADIDNYIDSTGLLDTPNLEIGIEVYDYACKELEMMIERANGYTKKVCYYDLAGEKKPYSKPILKMLGSRRHSKLVIIDDPSRELSERKENIEKWYNRLFHTEMTIGQVPSHREPFVFKEDLLIKCFGVDTIKGTYEPFYGLIDKMKIHNFNKRTWSELHKTELSEALNHDELVELCWRLGNDREHLENRLKNIYKIISEVTVPVENPQEIIIKMLNFSNRQAGCNPNG